MLGLPVLASDIPVFRERIGAGGLLFPRGVSRALACILLKLLERPEKLAKLRAMIRAPLDFDDHLDYLEDLYLDVAAEGPTARLDHFDAQAHLIHEFGRFDARERYALRWHSRIAEEFDREREP